MIQQATTKDAPLAASLACRLWPDNSPGDMERELRQLIEKGAAFFLAWEEERAVGFAQCQLRHDYVEGTDSSPVGYLEGIYVADAHRRSGVARMLLHACEDWARSVGCTEFASDCEIDNHDSLAWHLKAGFEEVNRTIWFAKKL